MITSAKKLEFTSMRILSSASFIFKHFSHESLLLIIQDNQFNILSNFTAIFSILYMNVVKLWREKVSEITEFIIHLNNRKSIT